MISPSLQMTSGRSCILSHARNSLELLFISFSADSDIHSCGTFRPGTDTGTFKGVLVVFKLGVRSCGRAEGGGKLGKEDGPEGTKSHEP